MSTLPAEVHVKIMSRSFWKLGSYQTVVLLLLCLVKGTALAEESFGKLFLTPAQRAVIDQQRRDFLENQQTNIQQATRTKPTQKKKKSARLAPKISLTSVISTPEGQSYRLNGQYVKSSKSGYKILKNGERPDAAKLSLHGKTVHLKVGETYLPVKNKVEKNYKIHPPKKQEALKLHPSSNKLSTKRVDKSQSDLNAELKVLKALSKAVK